MQWASTMPCPSLLIQRLGNGQCLRIEFNDRVDRRSLFIQLFDPLLQVLHQRYRTQLIALHSFAEFIDT
ncbi:hypothetical protein D3C84_842390 [compost metagenome]